MGEIRDIRPGVLQPLQTEFPPEEMVEVRKNDLSWLLRSRTAAVKEGGLDGPLPREEFETIYRLSAALHDLYPREWS